MVSRAQAKFIKSLQLKKQRKAEGFFIVEGRKSVLEVLESDYAVEMLLATESFLNAWDQKTQDYEAIQVSAKELAQLGTFKSNDSAMAVVKIPFYEEVNPIDNNYIIALDSINDPGNLGTIIRLADWYDIKDIVASKNTADMYNPKVISASKGSFTRVKIHYLDLDSFFQKCNVPIYSAELTGKSIHQIDFGQKGILLLGSEAHGVSSDLASFVTQKITIPRYGKAESLNVAMATGIILDNIKRN